ncbi:zinc finger protein 691-like [Drosophila kikkawai]|uniref:Zinc finger protein 691-like n=1 Tax=Drosophila kikkawai TaxID=30033 RepID=A0ABM4GEH2_DROKI
MGFRCLKCPKISTRLSNAVRHENTVHDKISYDCKKCSESFHSRESLAKHHQKFKQCAEITTQLSSAIREEKTIHGGKYACKKCRESFRSRVSLTKHKWKHRNHVCHYPNCQKKFKLWEPYVSHLNWHKHNGSRCPVPGCKSIMMPGDHIKHLKTHSKNQVTFYEGVEIISPKGALMGTRKA